MAHFVAGLLGGLAAHPEVAVLPYVLSLRARLRPTGSSPVLGPARVGAAPVGRAPVGTVRLPLPAGVALRIWCHLDHPTVDRWITPRGTRARGNRARVLHATNFFAPPVRSAATVVTIHDCSFLRSPELASPAVRRLAPALCRAIRRGAWVHTPSRHVASEVAERFSTDRVVPVPSGIPSLAGPSLSGPSLSGPSLSGTATAGPGRPPGDRPYGHPTLPWLGSAPFVLALGTLEPRKNHVRLIAAFGEVGSAESGLSLVIAGPDGPARPAVEAAIDSLPRPLRERIHILGLVDEATRSRLLRSAAVLAYPSLDEGFGFPALEAMAVGTPVVAAAAGAIPEVAGDGALLVDPTNVGAIASGLTAALGDSALRRRLVEAGYRQAARFSWEETAAGLTALYLRAAGG